MSTRARELRPALLLAVLLVPAAPAYEPAMTPEPPPPPRYAVRVQEGSPWGTPFGNVPALAGETRGHLFLRLAPPPRGRYAPLPGLAGARDGTTLQVWEVPPALHAPARPGAGWADLGPTPEDGTYSLHVKLRGLDAVAFELVLGRETVVLRPAQDLAARVQEGGDAGPAALRSSAETLDRLPPGSFTYRYDPPHGSFNRVFVRRLWERTIRDTPGVARLSWPGRRLTDPVFRQFLEEGGPPLMATDPSEVLETMRWMARVSDANVQVRWYGGAVWDLRDIRRGVVPHPHALPNLHVTSTGKRESDVFSPEAAHARAHHPVEVVHFQPRYGLGGGVPLPRPRRTSVFSPDQPSTSSGSEDLDLEDLEEDLDETMDLDLDF